MYSAKVPSSACAFFLFDKLVESNIALQVKLAFRDLVALWLADDRFGKDGLGPQFDLNGLKGFWQRYF